MMPHYYRGFLDEINNNLSIRIVYYNYEFITIKLIKQSTFNNK